MQYNLYRNEAGAAITAIDSNGDMFQATNTHPNWDAIVKGVTSEDENVFRLFDHGKHAADKFERISDRVTVANGQVFFDNEEITGPLPDQILRFIEQDVDNWVPLVNFIEKIMTNLEPHTREQLYAWLTKQQITITEDGDFLAYKGVRDSSKEGKYFSIHSGRAIVDGQVYNGPIPNYVGAVVEMPRNEVQHDPSVGCHTGLHAGTWSYASTFGQGTTLRVKINPRDVVSVPTDCDSAKLRTCRYEVVDVVEGEKTDAVYTAHGDRAYDEHDSYDWGDGEEEDLYY